MMYEVPLPILLWTYDQPSLSEVERRPSLRVTLMVRRLSAPRLGLADSNSTECEHPP